MGKILIIDDEPAILEYLKKILAKLGYDTVTACDGISGCDEAKNPDIKLIISDLNMPGEMSGISFVRKLRALRPGCPIIVLTGYPSPDRFKEISEIGAIEFLTKPFEIPFLSAILKRLLPLDSESGPKASDKK